MNIMKKAAAHIAAFAVMLAAALIALPTTASAETVGAFTIQATNAGETLTEDIDYTYFTDMSVLTILSDKAVTISGTTTSDTIVVAKDVSANITFAGVNIDVSEMNDTCAFKITDDSSGDVTITLASGTTNILKSGNYCAGLQKNGNGNGIGSLTITGTGSLEATGGEYGAGIGGGDMGKASNITIIEAIVTAKGGIYGAGIGGGDYATGSDIIISDGSVKAIAGEDAKAIGGGHGNGAVTPTADGTTPVYCFEIENSDSETVYIDGEKYEPVNHAAANASDTTLYAYLTGREIHTIQVGSTTEKWGANPVDNKGEKIGQIFTIKSTVSGVELVYGTDYTYSADTGILTILSGKAVTISGTTTSDTIVVAKDVSAKITLAGVNIDVSGREGHCAFKVADNSSADVTIILASGTTNILKSGNYCAGLQKNGNGNGIGSLIITGTGSLEATGGNFGAGIGGGDSGAGSNISISGGTVTATGNNTGAGIGGGYYGAGSNISISGGAVTAKGGNDGAGIGGGCNGAGSNISISDGTVIATGGNTGAGIGGGNGGAGSNISISGGAVTAKSGKYGAGIGGGDSGAGSNISISGGSVKAIAGGANAIGGGKGEAAVTPTADADGKIPVYCFAIPNPDGKSIYIDGKGYSPVNHAAADADDTTLYAYLTGREIHTVDVGDTTGNYVYNPSGNEWVEIGQIFTITSTESTKELVYGTDYTYPADTGVLTILSDKAITISGTSTKDTIVVAESVSAKITLAGVNIDVSGTKEACAFKILAENSSTSTVTITLAKGSINVLKSGENCAGLQKEGANDKLIITGTGSLEATGGEYGAGIGGGDNGAGSNISISGGTVTATGGNGGAGIGGGDNGAGSNISISGGAVTAKGSNDGAGIGGGYYGAGSNISISGGAVTAKSDKYGAGIGGGQEGAGSNISISGGSVKAIAGGANVIGGGSGKDAVTPTADGEIPVYLLEIANDDGADIWINNVNYPDSHGTEKKIYAYLPAKTAAKPNTIAVGEETAAYCYNAAWLKVITVPAKDETVFRYTGNAQTYRIAENAAYTVTGNVQTDIGIYTVTVTLKDPTATVWNDGTTKNQTYDFEIKKLIPTVTAPASSAISYGQQLSDSKLTSGWSWADGTVVPASVNDGYAAIKKITDDDKYDYSNLTGYIYSATDHTLQYTVTITVNKATPKVTVSADPVSAIAGKTITVTAAAENTYNAKLTDMPAVSLTYKIGDSGKEIPFTGSFVIPKETETGTTITITAKTAANDNYNAGEGSVAVTVIACTHKDVQTVWKSDDATHWHVCNDCGGKVAEAEHVSGGAATYTSPETCTVCGYEMAPTLAPTPTPTATPVPTGTPAVTPTAIPEPTGTPVPTGTPAVTPTAIPEPTGTPVPTGTPAATPTATPEPTGTPAVTPTPVPSTQKEKVESFVSRMYEVTLGRTPDEEGMETWRNGLLNGTFTGQDIANGFIMSEELQNKNLSNSEYVDVLYAAFFGREADAEGKQTWVSLLDAGTGRRFVMAGFVNSEEFDALCANYGIIRGTMDTTGEVMITTGIRDFVLRIYEKVLQREGEAQGIQDWCTAIANGTFSAEDAAKLFFFSEEYLAKNTTNEDFVETLYETFMDRASDADGKAFWLEQLNGAMTREQVLEGFSRSLEFAEILKTFGF